MHKQDVMIKTGLEGGQREVSAIGFVQECLDYAEQHWRFFVPKARRNTLMYHNLQNVNPSEGDPIGEDGARIPLMRNLTNVFASRITEGIPTLKAWPSTPDVARIEMADVVNSVVENISHQHRLRKMDHTFARNVQLDSVAAVKVMWDEFAGDPIYAYNEDGDQELLGHTGDLRFIPLRIWEFCYGPQDCVEHADWALERRYVDEWRARALLESFGVKEEPASEPYTTPTGLTAEGYPVVEVWHRPTGRFPNGLFVQTIGGHVTQVEEEFPYEHGELPFKVWRLDPLEDSPFGTSHFDDAAPLQSDLNAIETASRGFQRAVGDPHLLAPSTVADEMRENETHLIEVDDPNHANNTRWLVPPEVPRILQQRSESNRRNIYDVFGVNEVISGAEDPKAGSAAKLVSYMSKMDEQKQAGYKLDLFDFKLGYMRQALWLLQQFADSERVTRMVGSDDELETILFSGAELMGYDLVLEPALGVDETRPAQAAQAEGLVEKGMLDPASGLQRMETGLDETVQREEQERRAVQIVNQVLAGQQPQMDPSVPPDVLLEQIRMRKHDPDANTQALEMFERQVLQMQVKQNQAQAQAQAQQQGQNQ